MRKPPTGEPCAGKPPARFGGRGGREPFPTPIQPNMLKQVVFHRWGKKKKAQEFRFSLERLDTVVKEMIVPLEF